MAATPQLGCCWRITAKAPVTNGVAIEVPDREAKLPGGVDDPGTEDTTSEPGASIDSWGESWV